MRSKSTEAGSSFGSCGTSLPRMARSRIFDLAIVIKAFNSVSEHSMLSMLINAVCIASRILSCSETGGNGIKYCSINSLPILFCPTAPENALIPSEIKSSRLIYHKTYSGSTVFSKVLIMCNSVVPAP